MQHTALAGYFYTTEYGEIAAGSRLYREYEVEVLSCEGHAKDLTRLSLYPPMRTISPAGIPCGWDVLEERVGERSENRIDQRMPPEPGHRLLSPFQKKRPITNRSIINLFVVQS